MNGQIKYMKKWELENKSQVTDSKSQLVKLLLANRGIKTKQEIEDFLNPKLENVTPQAVNINSAQLKKALARIKKAIAEKQKIIVFGDYDVDGVCGTAILWETLNSLGADVLPYIPSRFEEGYGLSETGIKNLKLKIKNFSVASYMYPVKSLKNKEKIIQGKNKIFIYANP